MPPDRPPTPESDASRTAGHTVDPRTVTPSPRLYAALDALWRELRASDPAVTAAQVARVATDRLGCPVTVRQAKRYRPYSGALVSLPPIPRDRLKLVVLSAIFIEDEAGLDELLDPSPSPTPKGVPRVPGR